MSSTIIVNEDFDFTGIFPRCRKEYNSITNDVDSTIKRVCSDIKKENNIWDVVFYSSCLNFVKYLNLIKGKSDKIDITASCKYLNYKLKENLKDKNHFNDEREYYNKIISSCNKNSIDGFDKCENNIVRLDEATYKILNDMNELYIYIDSIKQHRGESTLAVALLNIYKSLSEICKNNNNISFQKMLEIFEAENTEYLNGIPACTKITKILYSSNKRRIKTFILSTLIATSLILIITFIIYKCPINKHNLMKLNYQYTSCFSYLQQRTRKIINIWNKKYKEHTNVMNIHEGEYKNDADEIYCISYSSLDYG
ncbi:variable surface protein [Plasmodium gonderi]|uniref:Variable surface protein n=1 Tax=Plasmodium gonderi TaxID=77519 RepID=A0A1Y1JPC8_PLAGO|nr:variable surface protein [Plasmodium gonderi]GAW84341.1 variable surface protein [Plasmodium gonderi]